MGLLATADNNGVNGAVEDGVPDVELSYGYSAVGYLDYVPDGMLGSLGATINGKGDFQNYYSYNTNNQLDQVIQTGTDVGDSDNPLLDDLVAGKEVDFTYDPGSLLASTSYYAGSTLVDTNTYGYDVLGRMTSLDQYSSTTTFADYAWNYDLDNRVTSFANSGESGAYASTENIGTYSYDADGQLTAAAPPTGSGDSPTASNTFSNAYDANGNPDNSGDVIVAGNRLVSDGVWNYAYDAAGNLISQTGITGGSAAGDVIDYSYDAQNRLTGVSYYTDSVETQTIGYTYDMYDRLIGRSITTGGTTTVQTFVYDPMTGDMVLAFNGSGNLTDRFLWGPGNQLLADEQISDPDSAGNTLWAMTDNQGSVRNLIDDSGDLVDHIAYSPFGQQTPQSVDAGAVDFLFGYDGEVTDPVTGEVFADCRVYDPAIQRWDQPDPTGLLFGPNPYESYGNAPTNFTDLTGLQGVPGYSGDPNQANMYENAVGQLVSGPPPTAAQLAAQAQLQAQLDEQAKQPQISAITQDQWDAGTINNPSSSYDAVCAAEARLQFSQLQNAIDRMDAQGIPKWEQSVLLFVTPASVNPNPFNLDNFSGMFYEVPTGYNGAAVYDAGYGGPAGEGGNQIASGTATTALSTIRYTQEGESFVRYEGGNPAFTRVTPDGGLQPGTFAAPASDGIQPLGSLNGLYNLPNPEIPRAIYFQITPPMGTAVIGPSSVVGGTGSEVVFPFGAGPGTAGPALATPGGGYGAGTVE
jgi:RHS repeat-associated protein